MIAWLLGGNLGASGALVWTAPPWAPGLAGLAALIAVGVAIATARRSATFWWELLCLIPALALLVVAAAGPAWVEESGHEEAPRLAVLIDDSRSMTVREGGAPRSAQVELARAALGGLDRVDTYLFGRELTAGGEPGFAQGFTDLSGALEAVSDRYVGERLAGVVVISDGLDRGGARAEWKEGAPIALPPLPGPLTIYQVGDVGSVLDLSVAELQTGGFAFIRSPFTLTARLEGVGYENREVPVTLSRDGKVLTRKTVQMDDQGRAEIDFTDTPRDVGRYTYEVSVPSYDDDAVPDNNAHSVVVRVVRDRMRILQVCGSPSFDQKFLRLFLKQDPSVDLVSFFILRTNQDLNTGYDNSELSLIPFPYERLFDEDLWTFDLVIFQNFDYAPFFDRSSEALLGNIADFVREGGAFVMIGGDRSFDLGEYAGTPLEAVLPVELGLQGAMTDDDAFQPELTSDGSLHPITRLVADGVENQALWGRLSPLDGLNLTGGLARGSAALLRHPTLKTRDGEAMPVVAIREVGEGRTLALMGDSSWRWVMAEAARGQGNQAYLRFWKNAMRWLIQDPDGQRVQIEATRENYREGDAVKLIARVRDVGFNPVAGARVIGEVTGDGAPIPIEGVTDIYGEAVIELPVERRGAYRAVARALIGESPVGGAETVFAVTTRDPELEEVASDSAFLEALAAAAGGRRYAPGAYGPPEYDRDAGRRVQDRVETPLWSAPGLAILVGLLLSLSWWLRRRAGLR